MSTTTIIALYGAVLSTFVFLWNFYRDLTNRGKLRVECSLAYKIITGMQNDNKRYLFYKVTNVGKQPVMLTDVGGTTIQKGDFIIVHNTIPRMLNPCEYTHIETSDLSRINNGLVALWAEDSLGRKYKVRKSLIKKLIEETATTVKTV